MKISTLTRAKGASHMVRCKQFPSRDVAVTTPSGATWMMYVPSSQVTYRQTTYTGTAMRKHGGDRSQLQDLTIKHLDALAHVRVPPMGVHGLVVRRMAK